MELDQNTYTDHGMKYALIQKIQNLMKQLKEETYHEQGKYNRLGIHQDDYDVDASMMVMNPSKDDL